MSLAQIISRISSVVWFFPLIKQYKTEYFYYFSVHALAGPTMLFVLYAFRINPNHIFPTCYILLLSALAGKKYKYYLITLAVIMTPVSIAFNASREWMFSISAIVDLFILLALLDIMYKLFVRAHQVNLLQILLVVYTIIDFVKLVYGTTNVEKGMLSFFLGSIGEMFFCAAFCFINVNTKNFKLRIKNLEDV